MQGPLSTFNIDSPSDQRAVFKEYYGPLAMNTFNMSTPLNAMIRNTDKKFTGKEYVEAIYLSHQGGYGSGVLPVAGGRQIRDARMVSRRCYQRVSIQGEAIDASKNNKGAFISATKSSIGGGVKNFINNASRQLFGNGSGILGFLDRGAADTNNYVTGAGTTASPYRVQISNDNKGLHDIGFIAANFEEGAIVQLGQGIGTGGEILVGAGNGVEGGQDEDNVSSTANLLRISRVDEANRHIYLVGKSPWLAARVAATGANKRPLANSCLVVQRSLGRETFGLLYALEHDPGDEIYGIGTEHRRWSALQQQTSANISFTRLRQFYLDLDKRYGAEGKGKYVFVTSYSLYGNLLAQAEASGSVNRKMYNIRGRNGSEKVRAKASWSTMSVLTEQGEVPIIYDRFCPENRVYLINVNQIKRELRPGGFRWLARDGRILLREPNRDGVEARYGGYGNTFIYPFAHGVMFDVTISA